MCALVSSHVGILPNGSRIPILCSGPQDSLLAPFYFLVYINDLPSFVNTRVGKEDVSPFEKPILLFADDTTALAYTKDNFQLVLDATNEWSIENRLDFQLAKTKVACFNKAIPKTKINFGGQDIEFSDDISVVGASFIPSQMLKGTQTLVAPRKALGTVTRCKDLARNGFEVPTALSVLQMSVSSIALYGSPAFPVHPRAQILQNELMQAILGTFRNANLARSHLCLSLLRIGSAATIRRVNAAMCFRFSPLSRLRSWIDRALVESWPWGKLLSSDLDSFRGLREHWNESLPLLDAATPVDREKYLRTFKAKVRRIVENSDQALDLDTLFGAALSQEIRPWHRIHPACLTGPRKYGCIWLRDSFEAPHRLHKKGTEDDEDDCPFCHLQSAFKPSHVLACPNLGPSLFQAGVYTNAITRWNLHDQKILSVFLTELKQRHLKAHSLLPRD